jgi:hypothetical protein
LSRKTAVDCPKKAQKAQKEAPDAKRSFQQATFRVNPSRSPIQFKISVLHFLRLFCGGFLFGGGLSDSIAGNDDAIRRLRAGEGGREG